MKHILNEEKSLGDKMKLRYRATATVCEFPKTVIKPDTKADSDLTISEKEPFDQGFPSLKAIFTILF